MKHMSTMSPTEEETNELLNTKIQIKVIEWDLFINRLKKLFPVPDVELEEMKIRRQDIRNEKWYWVRQADVNSRSSHRTDEAVSVIHVLFTEDPSNYSNPAMTDTYIPQDFFYVL